VDPVEHRPHLGPRRVRPQQRRVPGTHALIPSGSGFALTEATAINDAGQIVANGYSTTNYQHHAFLLNPR
jgi:probable HAF family extracellular repeat protein